MPQPNDDDFDPEQFKVSAQNADHNDFDPEQYKVKKPAKSVLQRLPHAGYEVAKDVAGLIPKAWYGAINAAVNTPKYAKYLAKNIPDAGEQIYNDPARAARNAAAGLAEHGHELINAPGKMADYMSKIGLIQPEAADTAHQAWDQKNIKPDLDQFVGGAKQSGDDMIRGTMRNANAIISAPSVIKTASNIGGSAAKAGLNTARLVPGASKVLGKNTSKLSQQAARLKILTGEEAQNSLIASEEYNKQSAAHKAAQQDAIGQVNLANHKSMEYQLGKHAKKMEAAKEKSAELESSLQEIPEAPEAPIQPQERTITPPNEKSFSEPQAPEPLSPEYDARSQGHQEALNSSEDALEQAKQHHENTTGLAKEANNNLGEHLKTGSAHDVHVGEHLKKKFGEISEYWKGRYKKFTKAVKDNNVSMPKVGESAAAVDMDKILEQVRSGGANVGKDGKLKISLAKEKVSNPVLDDLLELAPTSGDSSAATFLTKFKDFRNQRFKLGQRMKFADTALERDHISAALKETKEIEDAAKLALEKGLGNHAAEFGKLNEGYSKILFPLRENRVMKTARRYGLVNGNMINKFRASEVGQDLVRGIVKQDPEMLKHIVGQTYESGARGASKILNGSELAKEYTQEMPQLQKLIDAKKQSEAMVDTAKGHIENHSKAVAKHRQNLTRANNEGVRARKAQSAREGAHKAQSAEYKRNVTAQEKEKSQYETDLKANEKEKQDYQNSLSKHKNDTKAHRAKIAKTEKAIDDHQKSIKEAQNRAKLLQENMGIVKKEYDKKEIKLKQKIKAGEKLDKIKAELAAVSNEIEDSSGALKYLYRFAKGMYRLSKGH